jgi:hypothetical protein
MVPSESQRVFYQRPDGLETFGRGNCAPLFGVDLVQLLERCDHAALPTLLSSFLAIFGGRHSR